MILIGGRNFGSFSATILRNVCVVIQAEIGKKLRVWHVHAC